jgi:hypothetical protein
MRFAYIAIFPVCIASFATPVQAEDSNKDKPEYSTGGSSKITVAPDK